MWGWNQLLLHAMSLNLRMPPPLGLYPIVLALIKDGVGNNVTLWSIIVY